MIIYSLQRGEYTPKLAHTYLGSFTSVELAKAAAIKHNKGLNLDWTDMSDVIYGLALLSQHDSKKNFYSIEEDELDELRDIK